jgi:predicted TPR repeat methyltransferase
MLSTITVRTFIGLRRLACCTALILLPTQGLNADALSDTYQKLELRPHDVGLNLLYARQAEKAGKVKWALPAYERVLAADPGNKIAIRNLARIREKLQAEAEPPKIGAH